MEQVRVRAGKGKGKNDIFTGTSDTYSTLLHLFTNMFVKVME